VNSASIVVAGQVSTVNHFHMVLWTKNLQCSPIAGKTNNVPPPFIHTGDCKSLIVKKNGYALVFTPPIWVTSPELKWFVADCV